MTLAANLFDSHRYADALALGRQMLSENPDDIGAISLMADALVALERYEEAIPLYERLDAYDKRRPKVTPGHPGRQMDISCLYWFLGNRSKAVALMRGLADGILDGSIQYGRDVAGMMQGLLLYYMGATVNQPDQTAFALNYMRSRLKRVMTDPWPAPVARYYLGEISFSEVLTAATGERELARATDVARVDLLSRRHLCGALFHDGVKSRVQGAEDQCLARMRQCYALENPLIEHEWYLARYEVEQAAGKS